MSLLGSPFQVIVSTADNLTVTAGTDVVKVTAGSKTITLPLARTCTLEQGNNIIRVVGAGAATTVAVTSPDTFGNDDTTIAITDGAIGYCESDGLNTWYLTGRTS